MDAAFFASLWQVPPFLLRGDSAAASQGISISTGGASPVLICWSRVMLHVINRVPTALLLHANRQQLREFVCSLVRHLDRPEVCEVLLKLLLAKEAFSALCQFNFVAEIFHAVAEGSVDRGAAQGFLSALLLLLSASGGDGDAVGQDAADADAYDGDGDRRHGNESTMLTSKKVVQMTLLAMKNDLLPRAIAMPREGEEEESLRPSSHSLDVFIFTCQLLSMLINRVVMNSHHHQQQHQQAAAVRSAERTALCQLLQEHLQQFVTILCSPPPPSSPRSVSTAVIVVGWRKLETAKLMADMVKLHSGALVEEMAKWSVGRTMMDLFFAHPDCNFLHTAVLDFFTELLQSEEFTENRPLVEQCFSASPTAAATGTVGGGGRGNSLIDRILGNQRLNDALLLTPRGRRLGNMGHVTLLVDEIVRLSREVEEFAKMLEALDSSGDWHEYLDLSHREAKERNATILGGSRAPILPPPSSPPYPTGENVNMMMMMEEAGGAGGGGNGMSAISSSFTGLFTSGTDEQLARYFCQQVLSNLPNRFSLNANFDDEYNHIDMDDEEDGEDENDNNEEGNGNDRDTDGGNVFSNVSGNDQFYRLRRRLEEQEDQREVVAGIEIPVEPSGFDTLLEMEMRRSSLGDLSGSATDDDYDEADDGADGGGRDEKKNANDGDDDADDRGASSKRVANQQNNDQLVDRQFD
jgi:hypothetical protein